MPRFTGFALTLTAAGAFALAPALAQSSGSQPKRSGSAQSRRSASERSGQTAGSQAERATSGQLSSSDRQFIIKTAQGSMAEVALGKLAQERGSSDQVKDLGKQLEQDHQKSFQELQRIASSKGVDLPQSPDKKQEAVHDRLSKLSGEQFDRAFLKEVQQDHSKDIKEYERESQRSKDPDVKQYASSTLPDLHRHHDLAQQAMTAMGGSRGAVRTDESETPGAKKGKERERSGTPGSRKP